MTKPERDEALRLLAEIREREPLYPYTPGGPPPSTRWTWRDVREVLWYAYVGALALAVFLTAVYLVDRPSPKELEGVLLGLLAAAGFGVLAWGSVFALVAVVCGVARLVRWARN